MRTNASTARASAPARLVDERRDSLHRVRRPPPARAVRDGASSTPDASSAASTSDASNSFDARSHARADVVDAAEAAARAVARTVEMARASDSRGGERDETRASEMRGEMRGSVRGATRRAVTRRGRRARKSLVVPCRRAFCATCDCWDRRDARARSCEGWVRRRCER